MWFWRATPPRALAEKLWVGHHLDTVLGCEQSPRTVTTDSGQCFACYITLTLTIAAVVLVIVRIYRSRHIGGVDNGNRDIFLPTRAEGREGGEGREEGEGREWVKGREFVEDPTWPLLRSLMNSRGQSWCTCFSHPGVPTGVSSAPQPWGHTLLFGLDKWNDGISAWLLSQQSSLLLPFCDLTLSPTPDCPA